MVAHTDVHLAFGTYSFSLAVRKRRPIAILLILIGWQCGLGLLLPFFAVWLVGNASIFAVSHFILEGFYAGGLAFVE